MNKSDISREKIIKAAISLLKESPAAGFHMRSIAGACGMAVGSIYNYFPTKSDLVIAIIEHVWSRVFHPEFCMAGPQVRFTQFLSELYCRAYIAQREYHNFFLMHRSLIGMEDRDRGRKLMGRYMGHIAGALLESLGQDPYIVPGRWTENFTKEQFVAFVFDNVLTLLTKDQNNCDFFITALEYMLYEQSGILHV